MDHNETCKQFCRAWDSQQKTLPSKPFSSNGGNSRCCHTKQSTCFDKKLICSSGCKQTVITVNYAQRFGLIRLEFCQKMLQMVEENGNMLNCLFMSDEAHFDLNGNINKQNGRIWSAFQPTDTPWDGIASTSCHSVVCSFITLHCGVLHLRRKRSHRYGYWRPLLEHVERVFLSRITPNENVVQTH